VELVGVEPTTSRLQT